MVLGKVFEPNKQEVTGGWRNFACWGASEYVLLAKCYCGDEITEDKTDGTFVRGRDEKRVRCFDG
jgi:hypothetical protein